MALDLESSTVKQQKHGTNTSITFFNLGGGGVGFSEANTKPKDIIKALLNQFQA